MQFEAKSRSERGGFFFITIDTIGHKRNSEVAK